MTEPAFTFTSGDLVAKVCELAAEFPDRVIRGGCSNIDDPVAGRKSCIVGLAFQRLGVPPQWFINNSAVGIAVGGVFAKMRFPASSEVREIRNRNWLERVQSYQDSGGTWGEAIVKADAAWPFIPSGLNYGN